MCRDVLGLYFVGVFRYFGMFFGCFCNVLDFVWTFLGHFGTHMDVSDVLGYLGSFGTF